MQALYFPVDTGDPGRQCFGWLHPAEGPPRDAVVVLCPTVGEEYMMAHQALRGLAEDLAEAGFWVLRFDYDGTGDSSGDDRDGDRVGAWIRSVGVAIDAAKHGSGLSRVILVGERFGATLALAAANGRTDVARLQLVYPIADGKALAREIRAFNRLAGRTGEGEAEWAGFLFTAETMASLSTFDPLRGTKALPPVFVVHRDDQPQNVRLVDKLRAAGAEVGEATIEGFTDLTTAPHKSRFPLTLFDTLVTQLETHHKRAATTPAITEPIRARAVVQRGMREKVVHFGEGLVGIRTMVSETFGSPPQSTTATIFLNTSANHHVGPSRMYVRFARQLAQAGIDSLRFDLGLLGDSGSVARAAKPDEIYSLAKVDDVVAAIELMRGLGYRRLLLVGLCSGAFTAFHTAVRVPHLVSGVVLVNPQVFEWRPGDSLEVGHSRNYGHIDRYKKGLLDFERWRKLVRGEIDLMPVARNIAERISIVLEATRDRLTAQLYHRPTIADGFRRLVHEHHVALRFIYGKDDPGIDYLELHAGRELPSLRRAPNFSVEIVEEADHVFTGIGSQDHLGRRIVEIARSVG